MLQSTRRYWVRKPNRTTTAMEKNTRELARNKHKRRNEDKQTPRTSKTTTQQERTSKRHRQQQRTPKKQDTHEKQHRLWPNAAQRGGNAWASAQSKIRNSEQEHSTRAHRHSHRKTRSSIWGRTTNNSKPKTNQTTEHQKCYSKTNGFKHLQSNIRKQQQNTRWEALDHKCDDTPLKNERCHPWGRQQKQLKKLSKNKKQDSRYGQNTNGLVQQFERLRLKDKMRSKRAQTHVQHKNVTLWPQWAEQRTLQTETIHVR